MFSLHGVKALGYATELIMAPKDGVLEPFAGGLKVSTPTKPDFVWGNFLLFQDSPTSKSVSEWPRLYRKHFGENVWFYALGWETGEIEEDVLHGFECEGFYLETARILVCDTLTPPTAFRSDLLVRELKGEEWQLALRNHIRFLCSGEFALEQKKFEQSRFKNFQNLQEAGVGGWYGAFLGNVLIGDMGLFVHNGVARFQEVLTHFDHRRQAVCRNLCFQASKLASQTYGAKIFVTLASEPDAISAYKAIGFKDVGQSLGLRKMDVSLRPQVIRS